jgi:glycerol-3-phosphate dehydrogenase
VTATPSEGAADLQPIDRGRLLARLRGTQVWDAVIVGGGATGLGIAVDAAQRGLRVALIEAQDFSAGTSSRSTKLIHGGVRYLAQGNVKLVREALHERALLLANAPQIAHPLRFVVPCYREFDRLLLRVGLGMYDLLAGQASLGPTQWLSRDETLGLLPGIRAAGLRGGVAYWDAQFDDARMCIALMQTAFALGATPVNYVRCEDIETRDGAVCAVIAVDAETGERFRLPTRCVFNAAGVWVDAIRRLADSEARPVIKVSQGSHLVVDRGFMPASAGLLIPRTPDGRVLFVLPWLGALLIGTTDRALDDAPFEPQVSEEEIAFMLETARGYLERPPGRADVRSAFAGLRPLYSIEQAGATAKISREHAVLTEAGGLISVVGGKWTTYRRMAVDALEAAAKAEVLPAGLSRTEALPLVADPVLIDASRAGVDGAAMARTETFREHCRQYTLARREEDIVLRRSRIGVLDAAAGATRDAARRRPQQEEKRPPAGGLVEESDRAVRTGDADRLSGP